MQPRDADLLGTPLNRMTRFVALGGHDFELAVGRERLIVLRDLVALRQIRIKVILAREDRLMIYVQAKRERRTRAKFHYPLIQDGQRARQSETGGTRVCIWLIAETCRTAAEDFRLGAQLRMDLESDNCFPGHLRDPCLM